MDPRKLMRYDVYLRNNIVETYDTYLNPFLLPTHEYSFFNVGEVKKNISPLNQALPGTVMMINNWLFEIETTHEREIYNILDLVGDLGGTLGFFTALVGVLVYPISKFGYNLKALEKLYLVDSEDPSIVHIPTMKKKNNKSKFKSNKVNAPDELSQSSIFK